jgi:FixJ family two-component response regulator
MHLQDLHIALIDDDDSVRRAIGRLLRVVGMEVEVYGSGSEFLDALGDHLPDCVVLDIHMPAMSGLDVQAALVARHVNLPVVFMTAHEDAVAEQCGLETGAVACLHKPFSECYLLSAIATATTVDAPAD